jgi:hypothetical protein
LAAGTSCTIGVTYAAPAIPGATTGTLTIATSAPSVTGAPVALSGTSIAIPTAAPTLGVLDNFNRANANTLGGNWYQFVVPIFNTAAIRVNDVTSGTTGTGTAQCTAASCAATGWAYWGSSNGGTTFSDSQAAALQFVGTTPQADTPALLLKSRGTATLSVYPSGVRIRYSGTNVLVETNVGGAGWTAQGNPLTGSFAANDTLTAQVDNNGNVYVWKTSGVTTTVLGAVPLGDTFGSGVTGAIGIYMNGNAAARVDNFAGGDVLSP